MWVLDGGRGREGGMGLGFGKEGYGGDEGGEKVLCIVLWNC